jgi:tripartite-type tricarboxylate transporter receptor subunit TctC
MQFWGERAMKLPRRAFLHLAAGAAAVAARPRIATAQTYPTRPVRILVGFAAGGGADIMARLIGQSLSERLNGSFVVENRPGAGTNLATEVVANATPDGYTLLLATSSNAFNATLYDDLKFNFLRDIAPIAGLHREPHVVEVNPSMPVKTIPEFIAYAKANPDKINMASGGVGSGNHMAGELFMMLTGVKLVHVPYRGAAPALTDLLGGQVQVLFGAMSSSIGYVRADKIRALAVTTATRSPLLPDLPTVADFVPGYEVSFWTGLCAPKNTPAEIVDKLNKEINAALADPKMKARIADLGGTPMPGAPADFGKFVAEETERWGKVIRTAGIRAG